VSLVDAIGRALHRIIHPQHTQEQERLDRIAKAVSARDADAERLRVELGGLSEKVSRLALDKDIRGLHRDLGELRAASARQHRMLSQALRFADWKESLRVEERRIRRRVKRLADGTGPVLVGPWSGEVGFELLYWIPFVTWALREADVNADRLVIVSRGGPASWYAHLGGRYIDMLSSITPEDFRSRTEAQKKQRVVGAFDREIVRRIIAAARIDRPTLLHPGLMYRLFRPFWQQDTTVHRVDDYTRYQRLHAAPNPVLAGRLPADYVAVRFYFSASFPDTPDNRAFAESTVRSLAESTHVVMLSPGFRVDDHHDFTPAASSRIHSVDDLMTPERNLEIQTAVIAGARAFVGNYGGYAYLAPFCNVPAIAFYSNRDGFHAYHLELADRVFRRMNAGSLVAIDVRDAALLRVALGATRDLVDGRDTRQHA
jgi:hypothetical protein